MYRLKTKAQVSNYFSGNTLDRQSHLRSGNDLLNSNAKTLVFNKLKFLSSNTGIAWVAPPSILLDSKQISSLTTKPLCVYLGADLQPQPKAQYWAIDISSHPDLVEEFEKHGKFVPLRPNAFKIPKFDASILAQAAALIDWNNRYKYCTSCGSKNKSIEAGYKLQCTSPQCESHKTIQNYCYPRTDSVVITAVISPDNSKILLGRQKSWEPLRYSCIAGFVEPGESLEEACAREVGEETGIKLSNVKYHSSQPWPFPSHLMFGCISTASTTSIELVDKELEDAKWFDRGVVADALLGQSLELKLPPSYAIAYTLIQEWISSSTNITPPTHMIPDSEMEGFKNKSSNL